MIMIYVKSKSKYYVSRYSNSIHAKHTTLYYQYHRYNSFALYFTCSHLSVVAMSHSHDAVTFVVEGVQLIVRRLVELLHGLEVEAAVEEVDQVGVVPDHDVPPVLVTDEPLELELVTEGG